MPLTGGLSRRGQRLRSLRGERHLVRDGAVLLAGIRILSCGGVILHLDLREERVMTHRKLTEIYRFYITC